MITFSLYVVFVTGVSGDVLWIKNVTTKFGTVQGALSQDGSYHEFKGIPYGLPVLFKEPEDPEHDAIMKADNDKIVCAQFHLPQHPFSVLSFTRNCLILNIYVPHNASIERNSTLMPIMVFLHGGDFGVGTSQFFNPQYFMQKRVIFVSVNYRLNVYGFLNLGIKEAPGNAGLKDIRAALRWIQSNIEKFDGDKKNVTVFGQGSGGTAALYLMFSRSTRGLFHRIISQSGTLFSPKSFDRNPLAAAIQVAKTLGNDTKKPRELLEIFSTNDTEDIIYSIYEQNYSTSLFLPSIEKRFAGEEPFLLETPFNILAKGRRNIDYHAVPLIIGLTKSEGFTLTLDGEIFNEMDIILVKNYSALDQNNLITPAGEEDKLRNLLYETYFGKRENSYQAVLDGLIDFHSDFEYVGPMSLFIELYSEKSKMPVFPYIFSHIGLRNYGRILTNTDLPATINLDEIYYLFYHDGIPMDQVDKTITDMMILWWTNFAKGGAPTLSMRDLMLEDNDIMASNWSETPRDPLGEWLPYPLHMDISLEPGYVMELTPYRAQFWREIFREYGADVLDCIKKLGKKFCTIPNI